MHDLIKFKKNEKLIARVKMSCYTLFGVFHGHRPAVYINQHLLWALMSLLYLTLSFGSSRIASPAFFSSLDPLDSLESQESRQIATSHFAPHRRRRRTRACV